MGLLDVINRILEGIVGAAEKQLDKQEKAFDRWAKKNGYGDDDE